MRQTRSTRGFTLLELVAVMVIAGIALAMAAPSLRGWSQNAKLRDAAQQMLAAASYARSQAAATASTHRLSIDPSAGSYLVQINDAGTLSNAPGEFSQATTLPPGFSLSLRAADPTQTNAVDFYPNGRTTPAIVRITAGNGTWIDIGCETTTERFRMLNQS